LKNELVILKENSFIVDAHLDLLFDVEIQRQYGEKKVIENQYLPGLKAGGVNLVVSSIYIDDMFIPEMALRKALNQISALHEEIQESGDKFALCKSYKEAMDTIRAGKLAIMLSFEGVEPLYDDISLLRIFYELGVRLVGLTWNRRNYAAQGCGFTKKREGRYGGLSDFGVKVVEKAEELGMIIDVSHLNEEGFKDVIEISQKPIIASHSNSRRHSNTIRNLTDEQIKAIAAKDGVIGLNACSILVSDTDEEGNVEQLVNHLDYIVDLVGIDYVGIGFDFCDQLFKYSSPGVLNTLPRRAFDIFKGHQEMDIFIEELIKRGYDNEDIKKILGENLLRVFKQILL